MSHPSPPSYTLKRNEKVGSGETPYANSFVHSCQNLETRQVSSNKSMVNKLWFNHTAEHY